MEDKQGRQRSKEITRKTVRREGTETTAYNVRKKKKGDVEKKWECEKANKTNKLTKLTFHPPMFCVLLSKKFTSCTFKPTSQLQSWITKMMLDAELDSREWMQRIYDRPFAKQEEVQLRG